MPLLPRWLSNLVIILISLVWAFNFFAQFVIPGYEFKESIQGVFGLIIGGAFALSRRDDPTQGVLPTTKQADNHD